MALQKISGLLCILKSDFTLSADKRLHSRDSSHASSSTYSCLVLLTPEVQLEACGAPMQKLTWGPLPLPSAASTACQDSPTIHQDTKKVGRCSVTVWWLSCCLVVSLLSLLLPAASAHKVGAGRPRSELPGESGGLECKRENSEGPACLLFSKPILLF